MDNFGLGPLTKIIPFTGPVPPAMQGCSFWVNLPSPVPLSLTPGVTCGCSMYPDRKCPDNLTQCPGCIWKPLLGQQFGGAFNDYLFTVAGITGIDLLDSYFAGNKDLPSGVIAAGSAGGGPATAGSAEENSDDTLNPYEPGTTFNSLKDKLFRIYEIIPWKACGVTVDPEPFCSITPQSECQEFGCFKVECRIRGPIQQIIVVNRGGGYRVGEILKILIPVQTDMIWPYAKVTRIDVNQGVVELTVAQNSIKSVNGIFETESTNGNGAFATVQVVIDPVDKLVKGYTAEILCE
jgi:hypothetical protein